MSDRTETEQDRIEKGEIATGLVSCLLAKLETDGPVTISHEELEENWVKPFYYVLTPDGDMIIERR